MSYGVQSANSFNIGKEIKLIFVINGVTLTLYGLVEETDRKALQTIEKSIPTTNDGIPVRRTVTEGYEYNVKVTRQDGTIDNLADAITDNYFGGGTVPVTTATETIINPGPGVPVDQRQLIGCAIAVESLGAFTNAKKVEGQMIKIEFARRIPLGSNSGTQFPNLSPAGLL